MDTVNRFAEKRRLDAATKDQADQVAALNEAAAKWPEVFVWSWGAELHKDFITDQYRGEHPDTNISMALSVKGGNYDLTENGDSAAVMWWRGPVDEGKCFLVLQMDRRVVPAAVELTGNEAVHEIADMMSDLYVGLPPGCSMLADKVIRIFAEKDLLVAFFDANPDDGLVQIQGYTRDRKYLIACEADYSILAGEVSNGQT